MVSTVMTDIEVEDLIRVMFEDNYELLQAEGGHSLRLDVKNAALQQVLFYWKQMREVAENVTDTEVKLNLPEQLTPRGRKYAIEGIVDIIRENDRTVMYDIKTHDSGYVVVNKELYAKQLNVYAHIWQNLRGQPLNETAVIATALPEALKEALSSKNEQRIGVELEKWSPLVEIPFDQQQVEETIADFGAVVDLIEENQFAPPSVEKLKTPIQGKRILFATRTCRYCDARFSCMSYRNYVLSSGGKSEASFRRYFYEMNSDSEQEDWLNANLEVAPSPEDFEI